MQHYVDGLFASILLQFCFNSGVPRVINMFKTQQDPSELIDLIPIMWFVQYLVVPLAVWTLDCVLRRRSLASWAATPFVAVFRYTCLVGGLSIIAYTVLMNSWVRPQWETALGADIKRNNPDMDTRSIAVTLSIFGATCGTLIWVAFLFMQDVGFILRGVLFRGYLKKQKAQ
ncbi:hypothetical protein BKA57DRAFT_447913 [Linnemannia elongata]|uniref:Uncharacterized protein n=1 Tax=Linnemannia elongata AG-77 TaxID=1314771 RepID=A0A197KCN5_9FUNG|nr:hypothetical protein BGZ88_009698 [Linnemannia elongata]OAQ34938.1 hypothetical protein K457DRAFT_133367 [Linnemannia elongata AG-77]KAF9316378.1 hypothetical protein BGZ91_005573 [Linnemannia elongata]KAG0070314.1 hypothetical protein BGZ90_012700 [Linnemannia elongata]KAH7057862.1 hypothetical protein BKA57DRAFT_447913 [Linnemannia elongata]